MFEAAGVRRTKIWGVFFSVVAECGDRRGVAKEGSGNQQMGSSWQQVVL